MSDKIICPFCGTENDSDRNICRNCQTNFRQADLFTALAKRLAQLETTVANLQQGLVAKPAEAPPAIEPLWQTAVALPPPPQPVALPPAPLPSAPDPTPTRQSQPVPRSLC